jgi:hypothetical protein
MIGSRALATTAVLALGVVVGGGAPRPEVARAANAELVVATDRALEAIDRIETLLAPAVDGAQVGAARVVAGEADPADALMAAVDALRHASPAAAELDEAVARLDRARAALRPRADPLPPAPRADELASIAAQLEATVEPAADFAETRRHAEGVSSRLVDALDAVAAGEPERAHEQQQLALVAVDELRAWEDDAPVLSVWIDTVDAMIRAMQRLVDAVRAGDAGEAEAAQSEFTDAAEGAVDADRALRIGIDEAGSALTSVPISRLGSALSALDQLERAIRAERPELGA